MSFENGKAPASALARIYHPSFTVYLRKDAAAAWNTMCLASPIALYVTGAMSAYRTYAQQVYLRNLYLSGHGNLAAIPGQSNHGWALAVDLASMAMRAVVDRIGKVFGFAKEWSDAPSEWWHIKWREGVWKPRPNPGISRKYPVLKLGSGGPGQAPHVKKVQRALRQSGIVIDKTGDFGHRTQTAVTIFQLDAGMKGDGVVGPKTWIKLRSRKVRASVKQRRNT